MLKKFYKELETRFPGYLKRLWFQQDGASPHSAHIDITKDWLKENFKKRAVSKNFSIEWSPHSPDLSPSDVYLWGRVYQEKPRTLSQVLKTKIRKEVKGIKPAVLKDVMNNFCVRLKNAKI